MGRPLRIVRAGGWYHITGRGNERRAIFRDDQDRRHFVELLARMVSRFRIVLHAYRLMNNHYHLIIELAEKNLSLACQWLNLSYANWFNHRHRRIGHLFQGRFKSIAVDPLEWGLELSRYVHLNPVRIHSLGLSKQERRRLRLGSTDQPDPKRVKDRISRLRRDPWGSYRAYAGLSKRPEWLTCEVILSMLGGREEDLARNYREYVESAVREGLPRSPWENLQEDIVLGGRGFLEGLRQHIHGNPREQRGVVRLGIRRPELREMIEAVERLKGQKWWDFRDRYGDSGRNLVLYAGRFVCGLKLRELAAETGMRDYGSVSTAIRQFENRIRSSTREREQWNQLCQLYNIQM